MQSRVIILGASGNLGRALIRAFHQGGWQVVAQARRAPPLDLLAGVHWDRGPLDDSDYWLRRYCGTPLVVYAVSQHPARRNTEAVPTLHAALDIASRLGARLMFPGKVCNYGFPLPSSISEDLPQYPTTREGRLGQRLETILADATRVGIRSVVLRAGDFIGGDNGGGWFDRVLVSELQRGLLRYPGPLDRMHAWQDLDTLATCFVRVAEREHRLPRFHSFHVAGHARTGEQILGEIERAAFRMGLCEGKPLRIRGVPWPLIVAGQLLLTQWRELAEQRALWQQPHALDGRELQAFLGDAMPSTPPLARVVERALLDAHDRNGARAAMTSPRLGGLQA